MTLTALMLIATPLLAFAGAGLGHWVSWRSATDLDRWRKREETMRMLRWATEMAGDHEQSRSRTGAAAIEALFDSDLLDDADVGLVLAIADSLRPRSGRRSR